MERRPGHHYKLKSDMIHKFFNEPVDALDLRLTKAEDYITLPDPWTTDKENKDVPSDSGSHHEDNGPLDARLGGALDDKISEHSDDWEDEHDVDVDDDTVKVKDQKIGDVQFITARSLKSFRNHPYHPPPRHQPPSPEYDSRYSPILKVTQSLEQRDTLHHKKGLLTNKESREYDGYYLKKEVDEPDPIDLKISSIEEFSDYSQDNLLNQRSSSQQHLSKHFFSPTPSPAYLARSYQLLTQERIKRHWLQDLRRNDLSDSIRERRESVIVGPIVPRKSLPRSSSPSDSSPRSRPDQEWINSIQQLRERIQQAHQQHHQYSYQHLISGYLHHPNIKTEPEDSRHRRNSSDSRFSLPPPPQSYHSSKTNQNVYSSPLLRESFPGSNSLFGWSPDYNYLAPRTDLKDHNEEYFDPHNRNKRGRPRKHAVKIPLPPLYVFIRNMLHNVHYNPAVVSWVDEESACFKVTNTLELAKTWGDMKMNRSEEMNYEKMSRAMRYHYGSERHGRKGHLAMVKEKRLYYRFGELAVNWRSSEMEGKIVSCHQHSICHKSLCLWTKE